MRYPAFAFAAACAVAGSIPLASATSASSPGTLSLPTEEETYLHLAAALGVGSDTPYRVRSDGTVVRATVPTSRTFKLRQMRANRRKLYWRKRERIDRRIIRRSRVQPQIEIRRQQATTRKPRHAALRSTKRRVQRTAPRVFSPGRFDRQWVDYSGRHKPGTIIINTNERLLYLVQSNGKALRYGVGVGKPGFEWAGTHRISRKAEWPSWRPPAAMLRRRPDLPTFMKGGPRNPLGARALYLGSTLYRIHGSNEPSTIGQAVSSGCIRMRNEDVIDLYGRVGVGTKVIVI